MIKLYGFPASNYYNMAKTALIEKGVAFEEVTVMPSQDADYLAKSPMGKVPCIEVDGQFLAETQAIMNYLEETHPSPALFPADPFERAKARQLIHSIELYIELVARRGLMEAAFGRPVSDEVKKSIKKDLPKGAAAVASLTKFDPWIAGAEFGFADLFAFHSFGLANMISTKLVDYDFLADLPGASPWMARMAERESTKRAQADQG